MSQHLPKPAGNAPLALDLDKGKMYSWCACGLSSNQPFCDGKHKKYNIKPIRFSVEESKRYFLCSCKKTKNAPFCDGSHKG